MKESIQEQLAIMNQLDKKQDELYRRYALHLGISDTTLWVLYSLCETDEVYTQNTLAETWCIPKQTLNSVINNLVQLGYVQLKPMSNARNSKTIHLTKSGIDFCNNTIEPLFQAEQTAFSRLSPSERSTAISLVKKHNLFFHEELNRLIQTRERESK